jgi:hypothetical protein
MLGVVQTIQSRTRCGPVVHPAALIKALFCTGQTGCCDYYEMCLGTVDIIDSLIRPLQTWLCASFHFLLADFRGVGFAVLERTTCIKRACEQHTELQTAPARSQQLHPMHSISTGSGGFVLPASRSARMWRTTWWRSTSCHRPSSRPASLAWAPNSLQVGPRARYGAPFEGSQE